VASSKKEKEKDPNSGQHATTVSSLNTGTNDDTNTSDWYFGSPDLVATGQNEFHGYGLHSARGQLA